MQPYGGTEDLSVPMNKELNVLFCYSKATQEASCISKCRSVDNAITKTKESVFHPRGSLILKFTTRYINVINNSYADYPLNLISYLIFMVVPLAAMTGSLNSSKLITC